MTDFQENGRTPHENNSVITISRNMFLEMRQHCINRKTIQEHLQTKEQEVQTLRQKCCTTEKNAVLLEIKFCQLLLQIAQDSSSLRSSIFMSYKGSETDDNSQSKYIPQPDDNNTMLDHGPSSPDNEGLKAESTETAPTSTALFNKLTMELLKTKKQLLSLLQEKEDAKLKIPAMELVEYKEIVRRLQQELLTIQLQYAEMRLAAQSPQDSLALIGALQDQVRKQHTDSEPQNDVSGQSKGDNFDKELQSDDSHKPLVNSRDMSQWTLSNYRQEINELKEKCQRLVDLGPTWETLQRMKSSMMSATPAHNQHEMAEVTPLKAELEVCKREIECLKKENSDLKQHCKDVGEKMEKQSEEILFIQTENGGLKKQIKRLADELTESQSKIQIAENQSLVLRELERRAQVPSTCGREINRVMQDLSDTDLMVDGKESLSRDTTLSGITPETKQKALSEECSNEKKQASKTPENCRAGSSDNANTKGIKKSPQSKGMDVRTEYKTKKLLEMTINENVDKKKEKSLDGKMSVRKKEAMEMTESEIPGAISETNSSKASGERKSLRDGEQDKGK